MIIKKYTHTYFSLPKFVNSQNPLIANVIFTESCKYDIGNEDQNDINKLFGFGFFTFKILTRKKVNIFGKKYNVPWFRPMHHYNSIRFGWRYDLNLNKIEILYYYYQNGERKYGHILFIDIDSQHSYEILNNNDKNYILKVKNNNSNNNYSFVNINIKPKKYGYLLKPYFGGNQKAPHDIKIEIDFDK